MPAMRQTKPARVIDHRYAPSVSWTCIGRPDDPEKSLVTEGGALLHDYAGSSPGEAAFWFNRVYTFGLKTADSLERVTQSTESARVPLVRTRYEYSKLVFELLSFGHRHETGRADIVIWNVACRDGAPEVDTSVWVEGQLLGRVLSFGKGEKKSRRVLSLNAGHRRLTTDYRSPGVEYSHVPTREPEAEEAFLSAPHELQMESDSNFGPAPRMRTAFFTVRPGETVTGAFVFPLVGTLPEAVDLKWALDAQAAERNFWNGYPTRQNDWHVPDTSVMDMLDACARNILQARELKNGLPEFQVGSNCYRGLWVVDGHFILEAARYLGHESAGEQGIEALKRRVGEDGSIVNLVGHMKETGISIATLVRQCELGDDWRRLESLWSIIRNAVGYIQGMREASKHAGEQAPEYGLMPPSFGDGGLGGIRPEFTTALWSMVGIKWACDAARKIGRVDDADRFAGEFDDFMHVFREKAERDMQTLPDGTPYLPMRMPGGSGDHVHDVSETGEVSPYYRINPGTATWALAHAIYPGELFAPDDPIVQNLCALLDQLDDEEGIPANTGWLPHNAVWNYAASFYAHVWLYAGRPDKAIDYLYAFANHATPTRVWREEQSLRSAVNEQFVGDMPHNWASAEFIRLVRNLLVFEKAGGLDFLPALPPEWIVAGEEIRLERSPTRYGPVDLKMVFDENGSAVLELGLATEWSLKPRKLSLHVPEGFRCTAISGESVSGKATGVLELPLASHRVVFESTG